MIHFIRWNSTPTRQARNARQLAGTVRRRNTLSTVHSFHSTAAGWRGNVCFVVARESLLRSFKILSTFLRCNAQNPCVRSSVDCEAYEECRQSPSRKSMNGGAHDCRTSALWKISCVEGQRGQASPESFSFAVAETSTFLAEVRKSQRRSNACCRLGCGP